MAELQTITAICAAVKITWSVLECIRDTANARKKAKALWERTSNLYNLFQYIDEDVKSRQKEEANGAVEQLDGKIVQILEDALKGFQRTLDKLARRCLKLGKNDDLTKSSRAILSIKFTLGAKSIQEFEHQLGLDLGSLQYAHNQLRLIQMERLLVRADSRYENVAEAASTAPSGVISDFEKEGEVLASNPHIGMAGQAIGDISVDSSPITHPTQFEKNNLGVDETPVDLWTTREQDCSAEIDRADNNGFTALMRAAACEHGDNCEECLERIREAIASGANVNMENEGETALHMSVWYDNLPAAEILLRYGANADAASPDTPLRAAVRRNKGAFVSLLLNAGANIKAVDDDDQHWSLLHHAVAKSSNHALRALLQHNSVHSAGINPNARCAIGWTPLMRLAEKAKQPKSLEMAAMLLENGADVNAADMSGYPALYYVILGSPAPERMKFVRLLLNHGADVEAIRKMAPRRMGLYPVFREFEKARLRRDSAMSQSTGG